MYDFRCFMYITRDVYSKLQIFLVKQFMQISGFKLFVKCTFEVLADCTQKLIDLNSSYKLYHFKMYVLYNITSTTMDSIYCGARIMRLEGVEVLDSRYEDTT